MAGQNIKLMNGADKCSRVSVVGAEDLRIV